MPTVSDRVSEWKHAYQVLGVPLSASAMTIKQSYKQIVRRWHPDLYQEGTPAHAEATQMTKTINESYSLIRNAPLRYHIDAFPNALQREKQVEQDFPIRTPVPSDEPHPRVDRLEFAVRFVCGALLGGLISLRLLLYLYGQPGTLILCMAGTIMLFGFLAARYGDQFWHTFLQRWWIWW